MGASLLGSAINVCAEAITIWLAYPDSTGSPVSCRQRAQNAIDQCEARGGGIVRLPAGIWLTGTVYLESNLTLVLDKDCTLLGRRQHEDYSRPRTSYDTAAKQAPFRYAAILAGTDLQNVTIRGEGTIDGQGDAFRDKPPYLTSSWKGHDHQTNLVAHSLRVVALLGSGSLWFVAPAGCGASGFH